MNKKIKFIIFLTPLFLFLSLGWLFNSGLSLDPHRLNSPLINQPVPEFRVENLYNPKEILNETLFKGHVSILNVFASWCEACTVEHPVLMDIAQNNPVKIYGLNYKDQHNKAINFLTHYGNPYVKIGFDNQGTVGIDWGVYGTPESFIVDKKGFIRYKQIGPIDNETWHNVIQPLVRKLASED
jgi:cytochrome c biogenesis protein CcmG, thiol:disulfide interchange protein DsbE